jgi:hypothetical protein
MKKNLAAWAICLFSFGCGEGHPAGWSENAIQKWKSDLGISDAPYKCIEYVHLFGDAANAECTVRVEEHLYHVLCWPNGNCNQTEDRF